MLTQTDLNAIGKLIDKKFIPIEEKISRMVTKEDSKKFVTKDDLNKFATKDDLKRFTTKKDLKATENRIIESINRATDYFDIKIINHEKRIINLEKNYAVSIA